MVGSFNYIYSHLDVNAQYYSIHCTILYYSKPQTEKINTENVKIAYWKICFFSLICLALFQDSKMYLIRRSNRKIFLKPRLNPLQTGEVLFITLWKNKIFFVFIVTLLVVVCVQCTGWLQWDYICLRPDRHREDLHHHWRG